MTSTFIAGLRHDGIVAPRLFNCAIDGELFNRLDRRAQRQHTAAHQACRLTKKLRNSRGFFGLAVQMSR
jgi:hypothetical protein